MPLRQLLLSLQKKTLRNSFQRWFPIFFIETWKRCKFFVDVFALKFPDEMSKCEQLPVSHDPEVCVGRKEVAEAITRSKKPGSSIKSPPFNTSQWGTCSQCAKMASNATDLDASRLSGSATATSTARTKQTNSNAMGVLKVKLFGIFYTKNFTTKIFKNQINKFLVLCFCRNY